MFLDFLTHAALGFALGTLSGEAPSLTSHVYLSSVAGALAPDIDALWGYRNNKLPRLLRHRGITHSIPGILGIAGITAVLISTNLEGITFQQVFPWALIGCFSHSFFDYLNHHGVKLLWPFKREYQSLNIMPIFDPVFFILISGIVVSSYYNQSAALIFPGVLLYLLLRRQVFNILRTYLAQKHRLNKNNIHLFPSCTGIKRWNYMVTHSAEEGKLYRIKLI